LCLVWFFETVTEWLVVVFAAKREKKHAEKAEKKDFLIHGELIFFRSCQPLSTGKLFQDSIFLGE
jgi:hypothetical protein